MHIAEESHFSDRAIKGQGSYAFSPGSLHCQQEECPGKTPGCLESPCSNNHC
jgi:hypothetical protein